jgi:hypothetical protein
MTDDFRVQPFPEHATVDPLRLLKAEERPAARRLPPMRNLAATFRPDVPRQCQHLHAKNMTEIFSPEFFDQIPKHLLRIPELVREKTGIIVNYRDIEDGGDSNARLEITAEGIDIAVRRELVVPSQLAHEFIHLRRYILDSTLKLCAAEGATPHDDAFLQHVDNAVEHLFVVPEEIAACPGAEEWWVKEYESLIPATRESTLALTMHSLFLHIVLPAKTELRAECERLLVEAGGQIALDASKKLCRDVADAIPDKYQVLTLIMPFLPGQVRPPTSTVARYVVNFGVVSLA